MDSKLVQQMAQVGNQIEVTLVTGNQISGLLTEIDSDHITIDGKMAISVEAVITVQSLDNGNTQDLSIDTFPNPPGLDNKVDTPESFGSNPNKTDSVDSEARVSKKVVEIENRFNLEIQTVKLKVEPPDSKFLKFPAEEMPNWEIKNGSSDWLEIKNKYENFQNADKLSPKHDTIESILDEIKSLVERFPGSPTLKRVLAYFYSISEDWDGALQNYQAVAIQSVQFNKVHDYDWFNVAVAALARNKEELACYSLGKFFLEVTHIDESQAWNVYVNLLGKFNDFSVFRELCISDQYILGEEEIKDLLKTAIYLLKKNTETLAPQIMQKWLAGESESVLLAEACRKLDGPPVESYRQFLTVFMNTMMALKKELAPKTPKKQKRQKTPKKQKRQTHGAPRIKDLYRQAERANTIDKNLEKAERLYGECMKKDIQFESALKDRAMVLARLERYQEAEELLLFKDNRQKVKDKQSVDRLLVNIYQKWGQYRKAIGLLNSLLKQTQDIEKSTDIQWQIASTYLRLEDYVNAETKFRQVRERRPDNITVKRNIAVCLSKQPKPRYDEAEKILNEIQNTSPDVKTAELLEAIERAKTTGEFSLNEGNSKEFLSDFSFSGDASGFAQFFLKRCDLQGVRPERVIDGIDGKRYEPPSQSLAVTDMNQLARTAENPHSAGPTRPDQRAPRYLSAAKICDLGFGDRNGFYRYLCSSFVSYGDLALIEDLDTAQAWYREALIAYDKIMSSDLAGQAEIDAKGSLVRSLYAIDLPSNEIPTPPSTPDIAKTVKDVVIENCGKEEKVFNAIAYLVSHSQYANQQILEVLYKDSALQTETIAYLQQMGISIPSAIDSQDVFNRLWKDLENKNTERVRKISNALRVLNGFDLSQSWLGESIRIAQDLHEKLLFELDKARIGALQTILETALDLCGRTVFGDRERLCDGLKHRCQDLLEEIERKPTNLSIKYVYSIVEIIQEKVNVYFEELYKSSKPELKLRLAEGKESPTPENDGKTEVQIVVVNEEGRMPAESLKLITQLDAALLKEEVPDIELEEPLHGGKEAQKILVFHLHLTEHAIRERAFSLRVHAEYSIPGGEKDNTEVENLPLNLGSKDEFETIDNPYTKYANGDEVEDTSMFKGRKELIDNIEDAIQQAGSQSKCILVYGQYRSGKSSVRHHLKERLNNNKGNTLLVADLKDILLNLDAKRSVLCQILVRILSALRKAVKDEINNNNFLKPLSYTIPSDEELDNHLDPQQRFEEIISDFKDAVRTEWNIQQVVLLIDEFQHIYEIMVTTDKLSSNFMRTWKGFLQRNLFSAVLVGQQVMAKFNERFPNEFAAMQHEKVTYLNEDDAKELIVEPILKEGENRYREQAVKQILKLTASSPYYIQVICNQLVNRMNRQPTQWITDADVQEVAKDLVKAYSKSDFHMFTRSGDESPEAIPEDDALEVLKTIADNSRGTTDRCHRTQIRCQTSSKIDDILEDLVSRDVVEYQDGYYEIKVGLFKEWLIGRYERRIYGN